MAVKLINDIPNTSFYKQGDNYLITCNKGYQWKTFPPIITGRRQNALANFNDNMRVYGQDDNGVNIYYGNYSRLDDLYPLRVYGAETEEKTPTPEPVPPLTVDYKISEGEETHTFVDGIATINIVISLITDFITENVTATYKGKDSTTKTINITLEGTLRKVTGVVTIKDIDTGTPVVINGNVIYVNKPKSQLTNCYASPALKEYYKRGENFTVKLIADSGNKFTKPEECYIQVQQITGKAKKVFMSISGDKLTATGDYTNGSPTDTGILIHGVATSDIIIETNYGAINAYVVDNDILDKFAKQRFRERTNLDDIDLGVYVNRIHRIFADIPTGGVSDLVCGNYNTQIKCTKPNRDIFTLSFGNLTVPVKNDDNTDYESTIQLFLPFVGFVDLDNELMGSTVTLEYDINVITGKGVARLKLSDVVLYVWNVQPSTEVLYRTSNNKELTLIGGDTWVESFMYGFEPYIILKWYKSLNINERNTTQIRGKIGDFKGFNYFDNITTISSANMLLEEQKQIINLLERGVIIE